jgi:hypothetical protein
MTAVRIYDLRNPEDAGMQLMPERLIQSGGGKGIRTPDLYVANVSLSQLSYTPTKQGKVVLLNR